MTRRANHSGVASSITGGMKNASTMCWNMCTEYRYCSPTSCIGQSAAIHSSTMPSANQRFCAVVATGWPAGTARGPRLRSA